MLLVAVALAGGLCAFSELRRFAARNIRKIGSFSFPNRPLNFSESAPRS